MTPSLYTLGLFAACLSTASSSQSGSCSATTIWYNNAAQLQSSLIGIESTYSTCILSTPPTPTTSTPVATTTAPACSLQPTPPCFYIVGHGESHIEGLKLGFEPGEGNPMFNYPPTIFYIDPSTQYLHTATAFNGVTMTYYIGTESWWGISAANAPALYGSAYQPSTCSANADGSLVCYQYGGIDSTLINVWEYTAAPDTRAFYLPHWGPAAEMQTISKLLIFSVWSLVVPFSFSETTCLSSCTLEMSKRLFLPRFLNPHETY